MPLVRSFGLSTQGSSKTWVEPEIDRLAKTLSFRVKTGQGAPQQGTVNRSGASCIVCRQPVPFPYVRTEGQSGRMGARLMAIVAEGQRGRLYLEPNETHVERSQEADPKWMPKEELPANPRDFKTPNYGMKTIADLFTKRQLVALTTFSDLINDLKVQVATDAQTVGMANDGIHLAAGGSGALTGFDSKG